MTNNSTGAEPTDGLAAELAAVFAAALAEALSAEDWQEMRRRNATADYPAAVCASHDFCDANDVMAEAFKRVTGHSPRPWSDDDSALWSRAWLAAKRDYLAG